MTRPRTAAATLVVVVGSLLGTGLPAAAGGATIRGTAYQDLDRDGVRDPGEAPWSGHGVYLFDSAGRYVAGATTASDGTYTFEGLGDGLYGVRYSSASWGQLADGWVPTTTGSVRPSVDATVSGTAVVDFGWRPITWSTDLASPISTHTGPSGLRVRSYNDAVTAREVHDAVQAGTVGAEAASVVIRFAYGSTNATTTSVSSSGGTYSGFAATVTVSYSSWLTDDATLSHEYGHAWSQYHASITQQDPSFGAYLQARGLAGDPRLDSSYGWSTRELIAEDYRQLLGSPTARLRPQANTDLPPAPEVEGLASFLRDTYTVSPSGPAVDTAPPDVTIQSPAASATVSGVTTIAVTAHDDHDHVDALTVEVSVDGTGWVTLRRTTTDDGFATDLDSSTLSNGTHSLTARATDRAGNRATTTVTFDVRNKGGKGGGGPSGGGPRKG